VTVTTTEILRLAEMTRIGLDLNEADRLTSQMDSILDHMNLLRTVDTNSVQTAEESQGLTNIVRLDEVSVSLPVEAVLANAPETSDNFFVVPAVMGE